MTISRGLVICLILIAGGDLSFVDGQREYREECRVWDNVTQTLRSEQNVEMDCSTNQQCTGYDCDGMYVYNGLYNAYSQFQLKFCFGMAIHPCNTPTDISFYVELYNGNDTDSYEATVKEDDTVQIPNGHFDLGNLGSADAFVVVHMEDLTISGNPYMRLGLMLKIRVNGPFGVTLWPDAMQRTLMPDAFIPVPPCDPSVRTPLHVPHTCTKYVAPTGPTSTTTTAMPSNVTTRSCEVSAMYACKNFETCSGKTKRCECWPGYYRQGDQCKPLVTKSPPIYDIYGFPVHKSLTTVIIVGSVVSIMVVLGAIIGIVVWRYKRYRDRYGNHQLLMTSDDEEPLDIAA